MSRRRKAKPRLSPIWMPYLRDRLADWLDAKQSEYRYGKPTSDYADALQQAWSRGDSLRHSPMWYVSRDMTTLAVHTAMHETIPEVDPPSPTGFVIFDGGLNLEVTEAVTFAHVVALRWIIQYEAHLQHIGCALYCDDQSVRDLLECPLPLAPLPQSEMRYDDIARVSDVFGRILQAMWALSGEPTVCDVTKPSQPSPLDPLPPQMVDSAVRQVRMVILRENLHSPREHDPDAAPRREYSHRFIVRGFWRNQPYGKNNELRRRQWIPPFVKGPSDKPLVAKETVRIWKR
ncbi:hypothetical protein [Bifidobacterium animalis]|uniref:hypothetical protein n=1 Tax=Bifidobacterium animalis TaxID=28025 RepID=UPI0012B680CD|nr:hypothetical protein [Bifidobacterium animalis]